MFMLRLLNLSEQRGYALGVVFGSSLLGIGFDFLGLSTLAGRYHHTALDVALKLQLPWALAHAYFGLQFHVAYCGELAQSLEHGRQCVQASIQTGDVGNIGITTSLLAWV